MCEAMINFNRDGVLCLLAISAVCILLLAAFVSTAGCVTAAKNTGRELLKTPTPTPTPLPTPTPTPLPTPIPTPSSIPTLAARYVDPFIPGERWESQWYKWHREDVQGINGEGTKDLMVGIVAYRHKFLDSYTWYNNALGQYFTETPPTGTRYLAVWVHEEMLGDNATFDPSMWAFDETAFRLQINGNLYYPYQGHNPVNNIKEFEGYHDYYDVYIAPPFGYDLVFTSHSPQSGGWEAMQRGWLRLGQGNALDGYILFEVPATTYEKDMILTGAFSTFGDAYWHFSP